MNEPTGLPREAASVIFNLPGYHVVAAVDLPLGGRRVVVRADEISAGCPGCGVVSSRVHAWSRQRVKDVPVAGEVELVVVKPRLVCMEKACSRRTFTPETTELPRRARCTSRLRRGLLEAVIDHGRCIDQVARQHQVSWWTVQRVVDGAADVMPEVDTLHVTCLGIDEHRYRRVRLVPRPR